MNNPLVTVLMPVYNGQHFIKESIESILNQSYTNFEFLIINDGSTDDSEKIINSYTDHRIVFINNAENKGLIETLNSGIQLSKGDYIARMDADDISLVNRIEKQVEFLDQNTEIGFLGTNYTIFGDKFEDVEYPSVHDDLKLACLMYNPFCHPSVMFRKSVLEKNKICFEKKYIHAEEYKVWSEILSISKGHNLSEKLIKYRFHEAQVSQVHGQKQKEVSKLIRAEYLKNAGFELNERDLLAVWNLGQKEGIQSVETATSILTGMESIMKQNESIQFFDPIKLNKLLGHHYKNILLELKFLDNVLYEKYKNTVRIETISWTMRQKLSIFAKYIKGKCIKIPKS